MALLVLGSHQLWKRQSTYCISPSRIFGTVLQIFLVVTDRPRLPGPGFIVGAHVSTWRRHTSKQHEQNEVDSQLHFTSMTQLAPRFAE